MACPHEYENADYCPRCSAEDGNWFREENVRLTDEVKHLQKIIEGMSRRIAEQSELLSRKAEHAKTVYVDQWPKDAEGILKLMQEFDWGHYNCAIMGAETVRLILAEIERLKNQKCVHDLVKEYLESGLTSIFDGPCEACEGTGFSREPCKVCGNVADDCGGLEHGRGCYVMNSDGGGYDTVDECEVCKGMGRVTERK